jgi:hypothetical protein
MVPAQSRRAVMLLRNPIGLNTTPEMFAPSQRVGAGFIRQNLAELGRSRSPEAHDRIGNHSAFSLP